MLMYEDLKNVDVVIFGYSALGKKIYFDLKNRNKSICFCDNSSRKHGEKEGGEKVYAVHNTIKRNCKYVLATLYHKEDMMKQLINLGVDKENIVINIPKEMQENARIEEQRKKETKRNSLRLEIDIVKHCNLNCKGCDHFAPLAEKQFLDLPTLQKDLKRLAMLFSNKAEEIYLLGGEPLLNHKINDYIKVVRDSFPNTRLLIITNGILLDQMPIDFWDVCKKYNVIISPTKYPIKIDYDKLQGLAEKYGVQYEYYGSSEAGRSLWHFPLDFLGKQDMEHSFINCRAANVCITLENGRLFTCSIAANIETYNKYFKQNYIISEDDYIDIYKAKSADEILQKLARPIPFCRYCDVEHRSYDHPWTISKKSIKEWTL